MGGKIRSEYAMVGDVINLAARLMGKAKGRIVCDEVTHDLVSDDRRKPNPRVTPGFCFLPRAVFAWRT